MSFGVHVDYRTHYRDVISNCIGHQVAPNSRKFVDPIANVWYEIFLKLSKATHQYRLTT